MKRPKTRRLRAVPLAAVLALGLMMPSLPSPQPALAAPVTFVVNTTADSNGACESAPGDCSLREAINAANSNGNNDLDIIAFDIPGAGVKTIRPQSQLPALISPLIIDGYTQPGARENTTAQGTDAVLLIELDGTDTILNGLVHAGVGDGDVTIRGLVINNFVSTAVLLQSDGNLLQLEGNFIGTNADGTEARPNGVGVSATDGSLIVGFPGRGSRNLVSGNNIGVFSIVSTDIVNNLIGTDRSGAKPLGNTVHGINAANPGGEIAENSIAFNGTGITVINLTTHSVISRNAIFDNDALGIDLNSDGPTPNDPGDADAGPNGLQNFPELTSATTPKAKKGKKGKKGKNAGQTTISGTLNSLPAAEYVIELFASPSNGQGEGQTFLGDRVVTTNGAGNASFSFTAKRRLTGQTITATAISEETGDTSEFSEPVTVKQVKNKKGKKGKGRATAQAAAEAAAPTADDTEAPAIDEKATVDAADPEQPAADAKRAKQGEDHRATADHGQRDDKRSAKAKHRQHGDERAHHQKHAGQHRGERDHRNRRHD